MTEKLIHLWTDSTLSNFAIFFDSNFVAKTNEKVKYVRKVDETSYMTSYDRDWQYILAQWVTYYFSDKYLKQFGTSSRFPKEAISQNEDAVRFVAKVNHESKINSKQKPTLKCHFCGLKYCMEAERLEHEGLWHRDKLAEHDKK